jgi:signal transduction histidine kinase/AmiR/NasT family two-component response regulator
MADSWEDYLNLEGVISSDDGISEKSFSIQISNAYWEGSHTKIIIINDISHVKNYYKNLNAHKDHLLATVSHELRTPLNGILGMIGLAQDEVGVSPSIKNKLEVVMTSGKLLLSMINDILDMSLIGKDKLKLYPEYTNILNIVEESVKLLKLQATSKGVLLNVQNNIVDEKKRIVKTDGNRLRQILTNLIGNAIKFTNQGTVIVRVSEKLFEEEFSINLNKCKSRQSSAVSIDEEKLKISSQLHIKKYKRQIFFEVIDTGIGIKTRDLSGLFKLFGKLNLDDSRINRQGVGLGLAVSQSLVKSLNNYAAAGEIRVESEYGKGSRFYFPLFISEDPIDNTSEKQLTSTKFPFHFRTKSSTILNGRDKYNIFTDEDGDKPENPLIKTIKRKKLNVLIVDDDQINLLVASNYIQSSSTDEFKFSFQTALNGQMAVEIALKNHLKGTPFNIILMDCNMPVMDGFEATQILKEKMTMQQIAYSPIIAITANVTSADVDKCFKSGMDGYLSKPFKKVDLITKIQEVLKKNSNYS